MSGLTAVYVIGRNGGPSKVGISSDPIGRVREIQTGCPFEIEVWGYAFFSSRVVARGFERQAHAALRGWHLLGEWFSVSPEIAIEALESAPGYIESYVQDDTL